MVRAQNGQCSLDRIKTRIDIDLNFQVTQSLLANPPSAPSPSGVQTPPVADLREFELLATKWLAKITSGSSADVDIKLLEAVKSEALTSAVVVK